MSEKVVRLKTAQVWIDPVPSLNKQGNDLKAVDIDQA